MNQSVKAKIQSKSNEWYTPGYIVDRARSVLGSIDTDPATCALANSYIQAKCYHTIRDNGLKHRWYGNTFLNPPGGKVGTDSVQCKWWGKLVEEYRTSRVTSAIFIGFSIEILCTSQVCVQSVANFPVCLPRKRIEFMVQNGNRVVEGRHAGFSHSVHANIIVYLPPKSECQAVEMGAIAKFRDSFKIMGPIMVPYKGLG